MFRKDTEDTDAPLLNDLNRKSDKKKHTSLSSFVNGKNRYGSSRKASTPKGPLTAV